MLCYYRGRQMGARARDHERARFCCPRLLRLLTPLLTILMGRNVFPDVTVFIFINSVAFAIVLVVFCPLLQMQTEYWQSLFLVMRQVR